MTVESEGTCYGEAMARIVVTIGGAIPSLAFAPFLTLPETAVSNAG